MPLRFCWDSNTFTQKVLSTGWNGFFLPHCFRDIKLENILLDEKGNCKMCDVGLAVITRGKVKGYAGTPGYTAPEVILMQAYDKACDFFSFGVLIYRFLSGIVTERSQLVFDMR